MKRVLFLILFCIVRVATGTVTCEQLQIDLPQSWERFDQPSPIIYAARSPDGATLQIANMHVSPPARRLDDLRFIEFKQGVTKKSSRVVSETQTTVANRPAMQVELEVTKSDTTFPFSALFVLNDDAVYVIFLAGFTDQVKVQDLIATIHFLPTQSQNTKPPDARPIAEQLGESAFYLVVAIAALVFLLRSRRGSTV